MYEADLNGRQIQKYPLGSAASGLIEIEVKGLAGIPPPSQQSRTDCRAPDPGAAWG